MKHPDARTESPIDTILTLPCEQPLTSSDLSQGRYAVQGRLDFIRHWAARHLRDVPVKFRMDGNAVHRYRKRAGPISVVLYITDPAVDTVECWSKIAQLQETCSLPLKVIGGGTNLYITERGFDGILVIYKYRDTVEIDAASGMVSCTASTPLSYLVHQACINGLDMVDLWGIPGTVGGAVCNNTGNSRARVNIGDMVVSVDVFDLSRQRIETLAPPRSSWTQRNSFFRRDARANHGQRYAIRRVTLRLQACDVGQLMSRLEACRCYRREKNRHARHNAGSFWVNRIANRLGPDMLTRDFISQSSLADLDINGVRYTRAYSFLDTASHSTDRDVALMVARSLSILRGQFSSSVRAEVEFLDRDGEIDLEGFLARFGLGRWQPTLFPIRSRYAWLGTGQRAA
jgi:UDP-N-acetylenolpyruvoylglucosamine reductase